jgi:UPF0042 nucleotide-binding protein
VSFSRFVIVTGLSGAGKSQAMKSFEDLGFYCLDNLPPALVPELVALSEGAGIERLALVLDVRTRGPFGEALEALEALEARGITYDLLFLDASDDVLVRRYSETRRRHPFDRSGTLSEAIAGERVQLVPFRARASRIWDTSGFTHAALKARIVAAYANEPDEHALAVHVVSFGFKFGLPLDADLVFDVRFLPNPNYEPELKPFAGTDAPVAAFLESQPETGAFLDHLFSFLDFLVPLYVAEGKSRLALSIGCTGGRHRSVYVAERVAEHLRALERATVSLEHRELMPA